MSEHLKHLLRTIYIPVSLIKNNSINFCRFLFKEIKTVSDNHVQKFERLYPSKLSLSKDTRARDPGPDVLHHCVTGSLARVYLADSLNMLVLKELMPTAHTRSIDVSTEHEISF